MSKFASISQKINGQLSEQIVYFHSNFKDYFPRREHFPVQITLLLSNFALNLGNSGLCLGNFDMTFASSSKIAFVTSYSKQILVN